MRAGEGRIFDDRDRRFLVALDLVAERAGLHEFRHIDRLRLRRAESRACQERRAEYRKYVPPGKAHLKPPLSNAGSEVF
jgi:hypothetical protein